MCKWRKACECHETAICSDKCSLFTIRNKSAMERIEEKYGLVEPLPAIKTPKKGKEEEFDFELVA